MSSCLVFCHLSTVKPAYCEVSLVIFITGFSRPSMAGHLKTHNVDSLGSEYMRQNFWENFRNIYALQTAPVIEPPISKEFLPTCVQQSCLYEFLCNLCIFYFSI